MTELEGLVVKMVDLLSLFRPLRLFGTVQKARHHLVALIKAIPDFLSVGFFFMFFFFVYAVFGLYLYTDATYFRCR